mmetsp:Transcript_78986/g.231875  ORF Transcript_78986/g.231875 Transcript_78986/m.231875 type:complete len:307 (-) Transcript_78986:161-1081(-)
MSNKASLVDQIKTIQRTDQEAKQQWWEYCDHNLGGVKDPNRHDAAVLEEFLNAYGSGTLVPGNLAASGGAKPQKRRAPSPDMDGYGYSKGGYDSYSRGPSHSFTPAAPPPPVYDGWGGYGGGGGGYPAQWSDEPDPSTAEMVKTGQRRSQLWKAAWQAYCNKCGNGFNDPTRYDDPFLVGFLDYIGQLVLQDIGPDSPPPAPVHHAPEPPIGSGMKRPVGGGGGALQPPPKRAATGSRGGYNNPPAYAPENDYDKAELVDRIKTLQRTNPEAKAAWWSFCEEFQQGVKDPTRHDTSVLLKFLQGFD